MKKIGIVAIVLGLLVMAMIPAGFADEGSGSGSGSTSSSAASNGSAGSLGGTPKKMCIGSRYSFDHTGFSLYHIRNAMKDSGKTEDPRYEGSVWRAMKNVAGFSNTVKWQACE